MLNDFDSIRFLIAFFCGYFLCLSGSLTQLTTNNGISSPSTIGMDGFAVFFVILTYFLPVSYLEFIDHGHATFIFFLIGSFCIYAFVKVKKKSPRVKVWKTLPISKVLIFGLSFNLLMGAIFSIVQFLFVALNFDFPSNIWFGSIKQYSDDYLFALISIFCISLLFLYQNRANLEVLNLGPSFAAGLGINLEKLIYKSLFLALILTGVVVSYFGVFSFLGLIFPHILRSFGNFKTSLKRELFIGPILMGITFSIVDFSCFTFLVHGAEIPVGMVSSVFGSIFLIALVMKSNLIKL